MTAAETQTKIRSKSIACTRTNWLHGPCITALLFFFCRWSTIFQINSLQDCELQGKRWGTNCDLPKPMQFDTGFFGKKNGAPSHISLSTLMNWKQTHRTNKQQILVRRKSARVKDLKLWHKRSTKWEKACTQVCNSCNERQTVGWSPILVALASPASTSTRLRHFE